MKKFFLKACLFVCIFYVLAFFVQKYTDKGVKKTGLSNYQEWNDIIESGINADLLIQGSSKAWVQISPKFLDSALQLNTYNLGIDGYFFDMQYYRFLLYKKYNKKPRYIIQVIDCAILCRNTGLYMFEQFIPYLEEPIIKEAVRGKGVFDLRDYYFPMYKYTHNQYSKTIIMKALYANMCDTSFSNGKYKGFQIQYQKWDNSFAEFKKKVKNGYINEPDSLTIRMFEKFLDYCNKENIKVIFVYTPEYKEVQKLLLNRDSILSIFTHYSKKYNIPFLDYSNDSLCNDTLYLYNSQHLNDVGVPVFNRKLANSLKEIIKK